MQQHIRHARMLRHTAAFSQTLMLARCDRFRWRAVTPTPIWLPGARRSLQPEQRSNAVTAIRTAEGLDPVRLRQVTRERFALSIGGGLGDLQGRAFRIGHLGDINDLTMMGALSGTEMALTLAGVPIKKGGAQAALEYLTQAAAKHTRAAAE